MLNDRIRNVADLERALITAERKLKPYQDDVRALPSPSLATYPCFIRWSTAQARLVKTQKCMIYKGCAPA